MWGKNSGKRTAVNIILLLLIIGIVAALFLYALRFREETMAHDEELAQIQAQQKQELASARQETYASVDAEYERQMQVVQEYLPGIVCWGDDITAGYFTALNYPYVLQTYINACLCDIYDFSSTIENAKEFTLTDWKKYTLDIPVVNMATGEESSHTVLGRAGAEPIQLYRDMTVGSEPSRITLVNDSGSSIEPLTTGDLYFNNVNVGGIEGVIDLNIGDYTSYSEKNYTFRAIDPPAEPVTLPAGTQVVPASADLYRDYIHIVFIGSYGDYTSPEDLVSQVQKLLSRQTKNSERYIVLGPYPMEEAIILNEMDSAMQKAFGNRYISIRKYLIGDVYKEVPHGKEDVYYIADEHVPPSLRLSKESLQLNSRAQALLGKLIFNRMDSLGYFSEVRQELGITETEKAIIQETPDYFESVVQSLLNKWDS